MGNARLEPAVELFGPDEGEIDGAIDVVEQLEPTPTDAAHEALKEAARSKSWVAPIRHLALAERAQNYLAQNKKAGPRADACRGRWLRRRARAVG